MALEDHPSGFYEYYLRTAEKFDKDFVKTCNEDLNLVLLPVSSAICVRVYELIPAIGQFDLRHGFHFHHQYQLRRREG